MIHKRTIGVTFCIMPKGWAEKIKQGTCPVCNKLNPRFKPNQWRTTPRACSPACTKGFWEKAYYSFNLPSMCFKRDDFTCQDCGASKKPRMEWQKRLWAWKESKNYLTPDFFYLQETGDKPPIEINLEADHIVPIALGGAEFDINNYQTLCQKCHKKKTKQDIKLIALARKN